MKYTQLTLMLLLLTSCNPQTGGTADSNYQRQVDAFDRQSATTDQQLEQTQEQLNQAQQQHDDNERLLQRSKNNMDRYEALLIRWERQADRQDKFLDAMELLLSKQKDGDDGDAQNNLLDSDGKLEHNMTEGN